MVTPSILEEANYIMTTEYPAARDADMTILPAALVPTDGEKLAARYEKLPAPIDPEKEGALAAALRDALANVIKPENDDEPEHIFFIGLAYLSGIDVEVNHELAVELITRAAEAGLAEAIRKLATMYHNGEGVKRDCHTAIHWQEKLAEAYRAAYEAAPTEIVGVRWVDALRYLGDYWYELREVDQAEKAYSNMLEASQILDAAYHNHNPGWTQIGLYLSYNELGRICHARGDLARAQSFYEKALAIGKKVTKGRDLGVIYNDLGINSYAQGDLESAKAFYEKSLAISEQVMAETGTVEAQQDLGVSYYNLGDFYHKQGDLTVAKDFYEKCLVIREHLAAETGTVEARRNLSIISNRLGNISRLQGDLESAKAHYEKCLAISEQLAAAAETTQAYDDLALSYFKMGLISSAEAESQNYLRKAEAIWARLAAQHPGVRLYAERLVGVRKELQER